ncbi:hypothetical protein PAT3040_04147 [Paenibacillus agaridevorans]|uniref:MotA/TolQ/ExbB proton channel domain-containing protein n=1 Tax=Paenibacillus agaridevorans TaxID=171404 RepID=A0A2R5ES47_9BACL|nr:hypothetical protein [Paenibacillus agaridevorans]GBG09500.1 hypothetical protein PAT3040_04147 [Paenibacillus agaridevorans]
MTYYYLLIVVSTVVLFFELKDFRQLQKKIYRNMIRNEKNNTVIRQNDVMIIYSFYNSMNPGVLKQAKLNLRAIAPDTILKNAITTIFTILPIVLAMMSIMAALSTGLLDTGSQLEQLNREVKNMEMFSSVIIAVGFVYSIHLIVDHRRSKLLQLHLAAIEEVERERSR